MTDTTYSPNPVLNRALKRWKLADTAETEIRQQGVNCDRFYMGEQWPQQVEQMRTLTNRPCLVINQLKKFVRQVTNDSRMNRPSVKVIPVRDSSEETAKILEGVVRHIQVSSDADIAYDTACESQVRKGWGYFRVVTEYEDENSFDQIIKIKRIKNAFTVYVDPNAIAPDYSDAKWYFIVEDVPMDEFKRLYPKAQAGDQMFYSTGDSLKDWQNNETVRVAEYWEVDEQHETLCLMADGSTVMKSELGDGYKEAKQKGFIKRERDTTVKRILWRKISMSEILEGGEEGQEWPGKYIPIIPVLGDDLDIDGKRYLQGMVWDAMDPQRQFNYMSTAMTEAIALAPKAPWIIAEGQIEGFERFWENANTQAFSYLPYTPTALNGSILPPPQRNTAEPPIAAMASAVAKANEDLKGVTGIFDASLGARSNEASGKAILARQKEGDVANFNYIDNLARAIRYLGVILLDLIPKIYDAPRVLQIVGEDDTVKTVHVNTPLDAKEQPVQQGMEQAMAKIYDLTAGTYDVTVVTGPSFATKRQEAADSMMQLVSADATIAQKAGDIIVKAMDFPLHNELAERLKKFLPPEVQDDDKQEQVPPQAKAVLAQQSQMIEQMTQALHQLQNEKEQKAAELESRERIADKSNETQLIIAAMKQEMAGSMELMKAELMQLAADMQHKRGLEAAEHQASLAPEPVDSAQP